MFRTKMLATAGAFAAAAAVLVAPIASAAPAPECGACWGSPRAADVTPTNVAVNVGAGALAIRG